MTTAIKRRRGTTTQHSTFAGLDGEITVDTTKKTLVVHNGSTVGGFPLALAADITDATTAGSFAGLNSKGAPGLTDIKSFPGFGVTSGSAGFAAYTSISEGNSVTAKLTATPTAVILESGKNGTGTYQTLSVRTGGVAALTIDAAQRATLAASLAVGGDLNIAASANINFGFGAGGLPTFTTRSAGTKIVYYSSLSPSQADYAVGMDSAGNVWNSVQSTQQGWDWYGGITKAMHLSGKGELTLTGGGLLGYGTGSGGTVTQATNKSTTVTLNKPCGQITTHNAALAAGDSVSFRLTNSLVSASDIVMCSQLWNEVEPAYYSVRTSAGSGACMVTIKNETAGALSHALVINFAVIKGSAS